MDPATLGVMAVVLWGLGTWSLLRSWAGRGAEREEVTAGVESPEANVESASNHMAGVEASDQPTSGQQRWSWVALAGAALAIVFGVSAAGGFFGSRLAAAPATTTTTSTTVLATTTTVLASMDDLTHAEAVWCLRDRYTAFQIMQTVELLGFWDFEASLNDYRDDKPGISEALSGDMERWNEADGVEGVNREWAQACRVAFETR